MESRKYRATAPGTTDSVTARPWSARTAGAGSSAGRAELDLGREQGPRDLVVAGEQFALPARPVEHDRTVASLRNRALQLAPESVVLSRPAAVEVGDRHLVAVCRLACAGRELTMIGHEHAAGQRAQPGMQLLDRAAVRGGGHVHRWIIAKHPQLPEHQARQGDRSAIVSATCFV
jgi:hypothetical protein